jgi:spore maturation protein CgeB
MKIFVFGSSLTSSFWNGAATYYRGIYKSLFRLGHEVTFAEPDIYQRQQNRDLQEAEYANVILYQTPADIPKLMQNAKQSQLVIKHSGVGSDDERLEREVLGCKSTTTRINSFFALLNSLQI